MTPLRTFCRIKCGQLTMAEARAIQQDLHDTRDRDFLMFCSHPPTYSMGSRASPADILSTDPAIRALCQSVDRGGQTTFHGPGQLMVYPILSLDRLEPRIRVVDYIRLLEQVIVRTLSGYGIACQLDPDRSGVWTEHGKIASIGIRVRGNRTLHGIAINQSVKKAWFRHIVACGERHPRVSTLQDFLPRRVPVSASALARDVSRAFHEVFNAETDPLPYPKTKSLATLGAAETFL